MSKKKKLEEQAKCEAREFAELLETARIRFSFTDVEFADTLRVASEAYLTKAVENIADQISKAGRVKEEI